MSIRGAAKAFDGTSQPHGKVQQLLNIHAESFYKLENKVLLRPTRLQLKIKNHSKRSMFKAVSSFSYIKQYDCLKNACMYQYYRDFTLESNESNVSVDKELKTNQYYFVTFPISKATRKGYKSNRIEASPTKEKFTKIRSKYLKFQG